MKWLAVYLGACIGAGLMLLVVSMKTSGGVYVPCGVAEISPDFPPALREMCRRQR